MTGPVREADLPPAIEGSKRGFAGRPSSRKPLPTPLHEPEIRELMWRSVGLFRERSGLADAVAVLSAEEAALEDRLTAGPALDREGWRRASLVTVATLIARAALRREESRGGHFRHDFPAHDDLKWKVHVSDALVYR
jgi:L-aspartate oxidase